MGAFENLEQLRRLFKECAEDKNYVWQTSYKATRNEGFSARNNFICQFQKEIEDLAGDVLDLCKDLIDANKDLMYEVSYEDVVSSVKNRQEWHQTFSLFVFYCSKIKQYEKDERDGKCRYYFKDESTLPFLNFSDLLYERKENGRIDSGTVNRSSEDYKLIREYAISKNTFEYKLCSLLSDYVHEKGGMGPIKSNVLECLASTVCLYTALKNEKVKLYRQNGYFPDTKTQGAKASTKAKKVELPAELDTEEGRELLRKVIEAGFCDENYVWDETKWRDGEDLEGLVYFVEKANRELKLQKEQKNGRFYSWKPFDMLFTYRGKTTRQDGKTQLQIVRKNLVRYQTNKKRFEPSKSVKDKIDPLFS